MTTPPSVPPATETGARRSPLAGLALGLAVVVLAVVAGVLVDRSSQPQPVPSTTAVAATGATTELTVTARDMRYDVDTVEVPVGDRLVITFVNDDDMRHDLVLANGTRTPVISPGDSATLDAGVVGSGLLAWCSLPGHRQAGMEFTIVAAGGPESSAGHDHSAHDTDARTDGGSASGATPPELDVMAEPGADFEARDATLPPAPTQTVHRVTLHAQEIRREVAPGVTQQLWTYNGTAPGPTLRGKVGDVFEITLVNDGEMDHSIDFHAGSLAPDRPMRSIAPGESLVYRFTATRAGIWMYHCSTMPMLHHIGNGMFGAVIIDPPDLPEVDREYVLIQSELYLGPEGEPGDYAKMRAEQPDAVVFNGYVNQYVHRPLIAEAGERVRIWFLDAGPNRPSTFHVVGGQFDTVYQEGAYRLRPSDPGGAQVLDVGPASGGFVELVFPEAGHYPFVNHAMVDAERGAKGVFEVTSP
jgi:nitrite reductase (NO-forming)